FRADPARFTQSVPAKQAPAASSAAVDDDVEYTCPMHPQIVQKGPGSCPICGMALEPKEITAEASAAESAELVDMQRRFVASAALTVP
ncbi:haloacid dehalogenase, partial [Salmonella enterica subsp. enterica serovar Istanbul]|nr:haloacid dehalogenase [Salmonella enterica subsp. enterica serovar Istanbul]